MIELEVARVRLRYHAAVAAALRRQFNIEMAPGGGYRPLRRTQRMIQQSVRIPRDAEVVYELRKDNRRGTSIVEVVRRGSATQVLEVPQIAVDRYRRRKGEVR
jgi:hypothetical protein